MAMISKLFGGMEDSSGGPSDDSDYMNLASSSSSPITLPPKPKGLCAGKSGMSLVVCQRYIEALPTTEQLSGGRTTKATKTSSQGGFNLSGSYSFYLIAKYGTKVQNQGSEGACTAFGNAHTIGAIAKAKGKTGEYDAWKIWNAQGQQPNLESSLRATKQMDFDGLRISRVEDKDTSVESFKRLIDSGKPVYAGSDIDGSWHQDTGKLTCNGGKIGAHAYSIQGYDDASRQFIVKNSWGDSWGDQGFATISYDCIGNMGWAVAYDITLQ
jgi:C1A family cysteine protease